MANIEFEMSKYLPEHIVEQLATYNVARPGESLEAYYMRKYGPATPPEAEIKESLRVAQAQAKGTTILTKPTWISTVPQPGLKETYTIPYVSKWTETTPSTGNGEPADDGIGMIIAVLALALIGGGM